jgi:hypothetical protein
MKKNDGLTRLQAINMFKQEYSEIFKHSKTSKEDKNVLFHNYLRLLESLGIIKGDENKSWKNPF